MKMPYALLALSRRTTLLLMLGLLPLGSIGCAASTSPPDMTITSINKNETWKQAFTQAWMTKNTNGDFDVVLVDQACEQAMNGSPMTAPVRQVMHIRILWSPTRDMKAVVSNASVKWYVIGRSRPEDVLEYSGIAFVSMKEGDDGTTLRIRNATLTPSARRCQLTDPLGSSRLEGTFTARLDGASVNKVLSSVKASLVAAAVNPAPRAAAE